MPKHMFYLARCCIRSAVQAPQDYTGFRVRTRGTRKARGTKEILGIRCSLSSLSHSISDSLCKSVPLSPLC